MGEEPSGGSLMPRNPPVVGGEAAAIDAADRPTTPRNLKEDLRSLGVTDGSTLLVHASLSAIGWVAGGAQAVIEALLEAVSEDGTLVMPTHSSGLSEPSLWRNPPVPESWWQTIRDETPAFDPGLTPTRLMGAIADGFRHYPAVRRSSHPQVSFAACGPNADLVIADHPLNRPLGEGSPLARLYELDGQILLLGVGHANNTSMHLAEYRANYPGKEWVIQGAPVTVGGERRWVSFTDLDGDDGDFTDIGDAFTDTGVERRGRVGSGEARLMSARDLVDFAADWMTRHRVDRPA
ncbi:MAG: AAC(3) family N-acetyltransferase [Actinomycetota bacterium]|nr:AAC(3) family N-acetyltransferase [Actinomycetota bacterium]